MSAMEPIDPMESTAEFEKQMAQALRRVDAPAGFAERLLVRESVEAHISESRVGAPVSEATMPIKLRAKVIAFPRPRSVWMSGAIAAALLVGTFVGVDVHRQHESERATQEFETATRITDQAMQHTREQLERAGVHLEE